MTGKTASICAHFHVCHTCAVDLEVFGGRLCRKRHGDRVELIWCSFDCPVTVECRPVFVQARSHSCARGGKRSEMHQTDHSLPSAIAPEWPRASRVSRNLQPLAVPTSPQAHMADYSAPQSFSVSLTRAVPQRMRFSFTHCLRGRSSPDSSTGIG